MDSTKNRLKFQIAILGLVAMPILAVLVTAFWKGSSQAPFRLRVPTFSLTDQNGQTFSSEALNGKIWIANFVFTRCGTQCPMLSQKMQSLHKKFAGYPQFNSVSFSVDPKHDTLPVLKKYAESFEAPSNRWHFLTGPRNELKTILEKGFHVVGEFESDGMGMIAHSTHFVLVNKLGQIVERYDVLEDEKAFARLIKKTQSLLLERF